MQPANPTTRFSDRSEAYARHRPSYPDAVFEVLFDGLDRSALSVADVGAGTGISSRQLALLVRTVIAVEPNAAMRERAEPVPNIEWRNGTAESTGLADKSVDMALAFQAFHWFDAERAFREFRRISRLRFGMVQYERDENDPFSAAYGDVVRRYATDDTEGLRARMLRAFADIGGSETRRNDLPFGQTLDIEGLVGRVESSSYLPKTGERGEALHADVRELFAAFQNGGVVCMAMTAHVLTLGV